jgi:heme/copper-type cytochrome/quinol oxidase subunit 2
LYREYFLNKGFSTTIPKYLTSSPNNSLLKEVKAGYNLIDPLSHISEIQRDFFYETLSLNFFNTSNNILNKLTSLLPNSQLISNLFLYTLNYELDSNISGNTELYKNQFRPMRKGISNMIRLHATGAIAMPTEIRLHILASSKDIIHSWAIPSAGIKIDCVPGYSSHRIAIFLVSGIF